MVVRPKHFFAYGATVGGSAVLTGLEFAFQSIYINLNADDGAQQAINVVAGRIAHLPGRGLTGFVVVHQLLEHGAQPCGVVHRAGSAVHVGDGVVPSGHRFAMLALGRVPAGRDVSLRPLKHDHRWRARASVSSTPRMTR